MLPLLLLSAEAVESAVRKYRSLGPLLGKIEELVSGTNSAQAPSLAAYYTYWEQAVFNGLAVMVLSALEQLHALMMKEGSKETPLFRVS